MPSRFGPPLTRIRRRRSPRAFADAARREASLRSAARATELRLRRAGRASEPVVVGPWLGEVGFEVLYWIPMLRRLMARHGIAPEQVTAISRGGAEPWYEDIAGHYVDALDLMPLGAYTAALARRRQSAGDEKQLAVEELDRDLLDLARARLGGDPAVVHPSLMFTRLRYLFAGDRPLGQLERALENRPLCRPAPPPPGLPEDYVALRLYFSDCLPPTPSNRALLTELVERLSAQSAVVVLPGAPQLDSQHVSFSAPVSETLTELEPLDPRENLAVQTRVIAGARRLVSTYGGFSYLGPLLGVDTLATYSDDNFNPVHLAAVRGANEGLAAVDLAIRELPDATRELPTVPECTAAP